MIVKLAATHLPTQHSDCCCSWGQAESSCGGMFNFWLTKQQHTNTHSVAS